MKSLYIHFPFCETKCHYCDFYSIADARVKPNDRAQFEKALNQECQMQAHHLSTSIDTIFFGGGTPSMTHPDSMAHAIEPLNLSSRIHAKTEWTIEANPSSITPQNLKAYQKLGINRISMGVQALNDELLKRLGRVHSKDRALTALQEIFDSGITNVSTDLLCGVPGQSLQDLESALLTLTRFPITHLSCYLLTLAPHHPMHHELPNEDTQLSHLKLIHDWMTAHGFEHYEISNFAKPGYQAQHNLAYWKSRSYLGLGPSAHSFDANKHMRWKNISSLHRYAELNLAQKSAVDTTETLTQDQLDLERWMLGLRLSEGFPKTWIDTPNRALKSYELLKRNLLEIHPSHPEKLRLTAAGFAVSDQVIQLLS
jgi:oxygen-independent coproporphyrinogen-3 oxidase